MVRHHTNNPNQIPTVLFLEFKLILKFMKNNNSSQITKVILEQKGKDGLVL